MSKHSPANRGKARDGLYFIDFWLSVATELGDSRLRINPHAEGIKQLIDQSSDHKEFLRDVIEQSYKRSRCHHLKADIDLESLLDILGETAYELQGKQADDLLDIELLEEIAWVISERYHKYLPSLQQKSTPSEPTAAQIISLQKTKILKANSKL